MHVAKLTRQNNNLRITIPKELVRSLGLRHGDHIKIERRGRDTILITAVNPRPQPRGPIDDNINR